MMVPAAASRSTVSAGSPADQLFPLRGCSLTSVPPAGPGEARRRSCGRSLQFFGKHASLTNARAFAAYLAPAVSAQNRAH